MVPPSSDEELLALRRRCASALLGLSPRWLTRLYFGGVGLPGLWRSGPAREGLTFTRQEVDEERDDGLGGATLGGGGVGEKAPADREQGLASLHAGSDQGERDSSGLESLPLPLDDRVIIEFEEGILDVFSDEYCNKHLMYSILELILVRLMPELAEKGIKELWEERLS